MCSIKGGSTYIQIYISKGNLTEQLVSPFFQLQSCGGFSVVKNIFLFGDVQVR